MSALQHLGANVRTEACDERSAINVATVPSPLAAAALMRAAAIRVLVLLRPTMARLAPSAASASAAANSMPMVAPVIDLLVVHGTPIQGSGHADDLLIIRDLTNQESMERHNRGSNGMP
jgi:hypothetical protein